MKTQKRISKQRERRGFRIGNRVRRSAAGRPRLSVFRSNKHIYAQVIDDSTGRTLAAASTNESGQEASGNKEGAAKIGTLIAERAVEKGITKVVFDRGQFRYHGRVAALADAARQGGLQF